MSYFGNDIIYVIVPTIMVTEEMINNSKRDFNTDSDSLRTSVDGLNKLFKVKQPVSSVFNGYEWYNQDDILAILATSDWQANP